MTTPPKDLDPGSDPATTDLEQRWLLIKEKFDAHWQALCRRGRLFTKRVRDREYVVFRFGDKENGRKVLRTIYIGRAEDEELIRRARCYLQDCRLLSQLSVEWVAMARSAIALREYLHRLEQQARRDCRAAGAGTRSAPG